MSIEEPHQVANPDATTPPPKVELIAAVPGPPMPENPEVMTVLVTLPPGSEGSPPHRHTGPAFGYVIKGEVIFEVEGQPQRIVKAGEAFSEPGGDVIHYRDGNNLPAEESAFVATLFGAHGQPMFIPVSDDELKARRDRRVPRS
jgi:quercetin dioxygenase-like cupin family protein